jgi:histone H3
MPTRHNAAVLPGSEEDAILPISELPFPRASLNAVELGGSLRPKQQAVYPRKMLTSTSSAGKRKPTFRKTQNPLREIRKCQKSTERFIPKMPFNRLVREITDKAIELLPANSCLSNTRIDKTALDMLHEASESLLVEWFQSSNRLAIHAGRHTLLKKDLELGCKMTLKDLWYDYNRSKKDTGFDSAAI